VPFSFIFFPLHEKVNAGVLYCIVAIPFSHEEKKKDITLNKENKKDKEQNKLG
jgi:hypothetical protein